MPSNVTWKDLEYWKDIFKLAYRYRNLTNTLNLFNTDMHIIWRACKGSRAFVCFGWKWDLHISNEFYSVANVYKTSKNQHSLIIFVHDYAALLLYKLVFTLILHWSIFARTKTSHFILSHVHCFRELFATVWKIETDISMKFSSNWNGIHKFSINSHFLRMYKNSENRAK